MKTGFDLLEKIYKIINVAGVNSVIDGKISRRRKKADSELQDIVILTLNTAYNEDVQTGTVIINMYCKNLQFGLTDEVKLNQITDAVITALEAYEQTTTDYFDITSKRDINTFQDVDQPIMSYTSLRINCVIQTD